ncbi:MAG: amidohydrolase family protein [Phycisphaerales bacterium]|nr:amidohydrolase family protein [Phycisphaerales bacterium]
MSAPPIPNSPSPHNRFGWDYRRLVSRMPGPPVPIVDAHTHIAGVSATPIYDDVRRAFGVVETYTMTQIAGAPVVRDLLGDTVRFIAFPSFSEPDRGRAFRDGYIRTIERFHAEFGSRMLKLWGSPRLRDLIPETRGAAFGATDVIEIDSPWRVRACEVGTSLGMMFMVHIADPDTWFAAKYRDAGVYGTKRQQYEGLERMLDRFSNPWIAAHMGGWPEDLAFLDGLLSRHPNLHLDTSAMKWQVRELSKHLKAETEAFFIKWGRAGRLIFGTDIVATDDHVQKRKAGLGAMGDLADSPEAAWELYASRYWCLRTLLEGDYDGDSPVADPDLAMIDPNRYDAMSAPRLRGLSLPGDVLAELYGGAIRRLAERWWR